MEGLRPLRLVALGDISPAAAPALAAGPDAVSPALLGDAVVSVVVVNWNGERFLTACLQSLRQQTLTSLETILVDNGSTDRSVGLVRDCFPEVRVTPLDRNTGFSAASNIGIRQARGQYIATLNNDAVAGPEWLAALVASLETHPEVGFCASRMVLYDQPHLVDACGDFYTAEGIPGKIGHLEPANLYDVPREVFGACAGAALYRRAMLEQVGGFDEEFFIVHEDSDLSFRARLHGYRCLYIPTAVVYHHLGASLGPQSDTATYHAQRNMEFVFFKNMPTGLLLKYLPLHMITDMFLFVRYLQHRQGQVYLGAKLDALLMMPKMLKKRREIQRARRVPEAEIDRLLLKGYLFQRLLQAIRGHLKMPQPRGAGNQP